MLDPMTGGDFVVGVLVKVAEAGLAELAKSSAKDAYIALKSYVAKFVGSKVEVLEEAPDSEKIRREVAAVVNAQDLLIRKQAVSLAKDVIASEANDRGRACALEFDGLKNSTVIIGEVTAVGDATGASFENVDNSMIAIKSARAESRDSK